MARLTRVQQQQQTHERLLDAGRAVLMKRGFLSATVDEIAEAAGFTRGAVYKHFGGKEGLWMAIMDAHAQVHLELLDQALSAATDLHGLVRTLTPNATTDEDGARWGVAAAEFMAAVAAQPETAAKVIAMQRRTEEEIVAVLGRHCQRLRLRPVLPLPDMVVLLGSMSGGLILRRGMDPDIDVAAIVAGVLAVVFQEET